MTSQNGKTDSDSVNLGSNPSPPANKKRRHFLHFWGVWRAWTSRTNRNGQRTPAAQKPAHVHWHTGSLGDDPEPRWWEWLVILGSSAILWVGDRLRRVA